jgi:LDH2 family malate/lactate/ureidoglycolate dehydrogenase
VFSGANFGPWAPPFVSFLPLAENPVGLGLGHFLGAMRLDGFRPLEEAKQAMDTWIRRFRSAETIPGQNRVLIPGDPERETEAIRRQQGIPVSDAVAEDLMQLGASLSLEL